MKEDPPIDQAINLVRQAFALLRELQDLRAAMPQPDPTRRSSVSREDRLNAYSVITHSLRHWG